MDAFCYETNYTNTIDAFNHMVAGLKEQGSVSKEDVPEHLVKPAVSWRSFWRKLIITTATI